MILRILKLVFGLVVVALGIYVVWQMSTQNVIIDLRRWFVSGGTQSIAWHGRGYDVNARLFATALILLPAGFIAFGSWLCYSAFRRHDNPAS